MLRFAGVGPQYRPAIANAPAALQPLPGSEIDSRLTPAAPASEPQVIPFSPVHDAFQLLTSRLLRPVWLRSISDGDKSVSPIWTRGIIEYIRIPLFQLKRLLEELYPAAIRSVAPTSEGAGAADSEYLGGRQRITVQMELQSRTHKNPEKQIQQAAR
jgi:hypothetical protein